MGPIVLDNLMCRGLEYRLFDCASNGLGISNCLHDADAGVSCVAGNESLLFMHTCDDFHSL